jgi:hypothetical protein
MCVFFAHWISVRQPRYGKDNHRETVRAFVLIPPVISTNTRYPDTAAFWLISDCSRVAKVRDFRFIDVASFNRDGEFSGCEEPCRFHRECLGSIGKPDEGDPEQRCRKGSRYRRGELTTAVHIIESDNRAGVHAVRSFRHGRHRRSLQNRRHRHHRCRSSKRSRRRPLSTHAREWIGCRCQSQHI